MLANYSKNSRRKNRFRRNSVGRAGATPAHPGRAFRSSPATRHFPLNHFHSRLTTGD
jgi:hypothetical protein